MRIDIYEEAHAVLPNETQIHVVRHTVIHVTCDCEQEATDACPDCCTCRICCRCCPGEG